MSRLWSPPRQLEIWARIAREFREPRGTGWRRDRPHRRPELDAQRLFEQAIRSARETASLRTRALRTNLLRSSILLAAMNERHTRICELRPAISVGGTRQVHPSISATRRIESNPVLLLYDNGYADWTADLETVIKVPKRSLGRSSCRSY